MPQSRALKSGVTATAEELSATVQTLELERQRLSGELQASRVKVMELGRSQEHYRAVVEHVNEGMVVLRNQKVVYANVRATDIAGISMEDIKRVGFLHRIHPDDHAMVVERQRQRLAGERVPSRYELRLLMPDDEVRWIGISVAMVPWDGEQAFLVFFSDISQRRLLEKKLRDTLQQRETILANSQVGITFNVVRRMQWVNDKFAEMTGYTSDELVGQSTRMFYFDDKAHESDGLTTRQALIQDGVFVNERQLKKRDGQAFWVQLSGRCVKDRDPSAGVIWTMLDITERRKADNNIRAALGREKELNDLRSRFVSMTSHEFRTPLAAIHSAAELLRDYHDRMPALERNEILASVSSGVKRMTAMLDRVLLIGQVDAHMLAFRPEEINLLALCQSIAAEARALYPTATCKLVTRFPERAPAGQFDPNLLRHILENLLSNAFKYSLHGGLVTFEVSTVNGRAVFRVADQGIGIPPDEMPHLCESFHRASNVGAIQGTGLGLAIVKNSVELHGGHIAVQSEFGHSTCFTVTI